MPELEEEQRNVRTLIRVVSGLVAWPALSIGAALALFGFQEHLLHIVLFLPLGLAAVAAFLASTRLALRFVPPAAPG